MTKPRIKAPEWIIWEDFLANQEWFVADWCDLLGLTYLDHTDSVLALHSRSVKDDIDWDIVARADTYFVNEKTGFRSVETYFGDPNHWILSPLFYAGRKWRTCRYATLLQQGNWCRCCGARPPNAELHIDHIVPRSIDPSKAWDLSNLQVLCKECNIGKGNGDTRDWRGIVRANQ